MRFFVAAAALVASASAASLWTRQTPSAPPACSNLCFDTTTNNITTDSCSGTDLGCLCKDPVYLQAVINCVTSVCDDMTDVTNALQFSSGYCGIAGVNTFPTTLTTGTPGTPTHTPASGNPPLSHSSSSSSTSATATHSQGAASSLKAPAMGVAALVLAAAGLAL